MPSDLGDTTQIQACLDHWCAGNDSAASELMELVQGRLFHLAQVMLKGFPAVQAMVDTDDVAMEVNLKLWKALPEAHPASVRDFMCWAATRMRWQLIDWAKKYKKIKPSPNGSSLPIQPADPTIGPATLALWTEFHELIATLDPERRELFDLLYYGKLTQEDAAAHLGVSLGTLKSRWKKARLFVYKQLNK